MTMIAANADYRPDERMFPRTQSRYSGDLVKSPPPIGRSVIGMIVLGCAVALSAVAVAWAWIWTRGRG